MPNNEWSRATIWNQSTSLQGLLTGQDTEISRAATVFSRARRIYVTGTGTSYHAAAIAAWQFMSVGLDAIAVPAYDLAHGHPGPRAEDVLLVFSHRGTKRFSAEAARRDGAPTVVITGQDSPLKGSVATLRTTEQEQSSMHTASFTSALLMLLRVAAALEDGNAPGKSAAVRLSSVLPVLPSAVRDVVVQTASMAAAVAADITRDQQIWFAGACALGEVAREAALKCREGAYARAEGLDVEQMLHGYWVSMEAGDWLVPVGTGPRLDDAAKVAEAVGARVWRAPDVPVWGAPALDAVAAVIPLQILALELASAWGVDSDGFRLEQEPYRRARALLAL